MEKIPEGARREDVLLYAKKEYGTDPEHLWAHFPDYAVLRRAEDRKWYAILMDVRRSRFSLPGDGTVEVLNVKCSEEMLAPLLSEKGIFPAYHQAKGRWISALLDGSLPAELVFSLLDMSYQAAKKGAARKPRSLGRREWLVPSNTKYCDMERLFDRSDTTLWKQTSRVSVGDTVLLYVGAPVSAVLYRCRVLEADIPYDYTEGALTIRRAMRLKLIHRFERDELSAGVLSDYGVSSVRGARGVPEELSERVAALCGGAR